MKIYFRAMLLLAVPLGLTLTACDHAAPPKQTAAPAPQGCVDYKAELVPSLGSANGEFVDMHVTNNCQGPVNVNFQFGLFRRTNGEQTFAWDYHDFKDLLPGHSYVYAFTDQMYDKFLVEFRVKSASYEEIGCEKADTPDQCKVVLACERENPIDVCEKGYGAGSGGGPVEQASQVPASNITSPVPPQTQPSESPEESIGQLLEVWEESFRTKNAARQADCYAPMIDRYFLLSGITHDQLRRDKERAFHNIADIRQYEIRDLAIAPGTAGRYRATFRKLWDTTGTDGKQFSGEDVQNLEFAMFNGEWKIVSETEPKVIHVIKGNIRR